jgi:hypothetical protein
MNLPTHSQIKRIDQAIVETNRLIANEERYSKDLQKADYLQKLYDHKAYLITMKETGKGLPVSVA